MQQTWNRSRRGGDVARVDRRKCWGMQPRAASMLHGNSVWDFRGRKRENGAKQISELPDGSGLAVSRGVEQLLL